MSHCIPHDLLIAKFSAYGVSDQGLEFTKSYIFGRKHRGNNEGILPVIGLSIFGSLIFNIFLNDIFLFIIATIIYAILKMIIKLNINKNLGMVKNKKRIAANPEKFQDMFLRLEDKNCIKF